MWRKLSVGRTWKRAKRLLAWQGSRWGRAQTRMSPTSLSEKTETWCSLIADSLAQNKPVVSIRHHNKELKRDPKTTRQTWCARICAPVHVYAGGGGGTNIRCYTGAHRFWDGTILVANESNHCLCRVGALSRTSQARFTPDVRNLTGMQESSSHKKFLFCSFLVAFWQKRSRDQPETAPDRGTDPQKRKTLLHSWSSTALHCRSRLFARESSKFVVCWSKGCRQASRHCQETF